MTIFDERVTLDEGIVELVLTVLVLVVGLAVDAVVVALVDLVGTVEGV